jgi:hypothetical protein
MPKEKKITVVFFLNKDVKPRLSASGQEKLYPIYCRVTYDRKNTKFKFGAGWTPASFEGDLFQDPDKKAFLVRVENAIEDIVRYEEEAFGENFTLKKLGERFDVYQKVVLFLLEGQLSEQLDKYAGEYLVYNEFMEWQQLEVGEKLEKVTRIAEDGDKGKLPASLLSEATVYLSVRNFKKGLFNLHDWLMRGVKESLPHQVEKKPLTYAGYQSSPKEVSRAINQLASKLLEPVYKAHFGVKKAQFDPQTGLLKVGR